MPKVFYEARLWRKWANMDDVFRAFATEQEAYGYLTHLKYIAKAGDKVTIKRSQGWDIKVLYRETIGKDGQFWAIRKPYEPIPTEPTIIREELIVPHEPVKGKQAGMLGGPGKVHTQERPYKAGQMELESYTKYKKTTMSDRFTIDCSYCGFLTSERTLKEALGAARGLKIRHQSAKAEITIFDLLAQRGACNTWDVEGHCIGYKEFKEKKAMNWKTVAELKQICSQRGLPTNGSKEDLIRRIK